MIFMDTETCGLFGPIVLVQYTTDDGPIVLHSPWTTKVRETLDLYEFFCTHEGGVCMFNSVFDWFHICQQYTTLVLLAKEYGDDIYPEDYIDEYAELEPYARDGQCLKPITTLDLMLHARKTEYQSTMNRGDIRIKKVPTALAQHIVYELNKRIPLKDVYFARKADPKKRWSIRDIKDDFDDVIPDFKDIVLKFAPSSGLKALAQDALNIEKTVNFKDVEPDPKFRPLESGWAPYAMSPKYRKAKSGKKHTVQPSPEDWCWTWPDCINHHITHWGYNKLAREYARDDVVYTRALYTYFGKPEPGDTDSVLACMVGAARWRGFRIDCVQMRKLKEEQEALLAKSVINFNSVETCKAYLVEVMDDTERLAMTHNGKLTTKGIILEGLAKWKKAEVCEKCFGEGCDDCKDGLVESNQQHPVASRAREILDARHAKKEIENYDKLLQAGRFHASFQIIGALSSRMSGSDGLNAQGIKSSDKVRSCFPLSQLTDVLCGGDFSGFEVTLMDAAYGDKKLRSLLQSGKKIHGIFGVYLFPGMSYDDILATKGAKESEDDKYSRSKNGVFALAYGGEAFTLTTRVGVDEATANEAYHQFTTDFPEIGAARQRISDMFCSMRQKGGIGTRVEWHDPADYIESMFGFRRYFTLENRICKALFDLAEKPPKEWKQLKFKVVRRDREQTAEGACRSALFAAAFALQSANMRAALNHVIQSSGATMTKDLQCNIWELQPSGISDWLVQPMNIHDEIMVSAEKSMPPIVRKVVDNYVELNRDKVPLLAIDWSDFMLTWAEK